MMSLLGVLVQGHSNSTNYNACKVINIIKELEYSQHEASSSVLYTRSFLIHMMEILGNMLLFNSNNNEQVKNTFLLKSIIF